MSSRRRKARRRKTSSERSRNFLDFSTHDSVPSYDGRILVVGAYEAGKTSLVMNLIGEEIPTERQSTDGIDVHFGKLLFEIKTQMFLKKKTDLHSFPKAVYQKVLACLEAVHQSNAVKQSKKSNQVFSQDDQCLFPSNQVLNPAFSFLMPAFPDFLNFFQSDFLKRINEKLRTFKSDAPPFSREVIPIPILDFAGQFVYYTTHQAFITSHGTYIVVFNGSKSLSDSLTGDGKESTVLDNIKHWVSSILAYSSTDTDEYPKIAFVATHKDLVKPDEVQRKQESITHSLIECFTDKQIKSHLILQRIFFVNSLDESDTGINELRTFLSKILVDNPQWKQKVPKQFLFLEMMLAILVDEGQYILSRTDINIINRENEFTPLSEEELDRFLHIQNSCGKLTYIDTHYLRNFIVINPTCIIDLLKGIVTAFPSSSDMKHGRLRKSDLTKMLDFEKFNQLGSYSDFFRELLVYFDILAEIRRYDKTTGRKIDIECYFVPCLIYQTNTTTFVENCIKSEKCISFAFVFEKSYVPPAITNRFISCVLSIWNVKIYNNIELLFSAFVVVSLDRNHDLVVQADQTSIVIYLIHKQRKELIIRDLASSVRQCLEENLQRISEVYSDSYTESPSRYVPFTMKVKSGCLSPMCLKNVDDIEKLAFPLVCKAHGYRTPQSELNIWFTDISVQQCNETCEGISPTIYSICLTDAELLRLSSNLTVEEIRQLAIYLGISNVKLDEIGQDFSRNSSMVKFASLRTCSDNNKLCGDFMKAITTAGLNKHTMCMIVRQEIPPTDLPDTILNLPPSDEMLDKLALRIGKKWMELGLELGLDIDQLEYIEYDSPNVLRDISKNMLYQWKETENGNSIRDLHNAFARIGKRGNLIRETLENCESFPNIKPDL
ncbi:Hypothetical predicted protein [Mytilus galloprovincialis]|uniref:Death domain-containing protein n=1 Tax=Mytilus galloprovincialis TaxID=29158 RepID=A0A8B6FGN8_MYTGA|nr:Hypothetical predicted protein [Mytilus galloprovincialis]